MERTDLSDRRFEVLLERLDRIGDELARMNKRLDNDENFLRLTRELASLNESLQAIAYAALGQQAPQVRRRRGVSRPSLSDEHFARPRQRPLQGLRACRNPRERIPARPARD